MSDPETGERRRSVLADVERAARVAEALPEIDFVMSMALPDDVENEVVDVVQFAAMLRNTRKPIVVSSPFGGETLHTMHAMAAACGEAASFACLAMSSPPLMLDDVAGSKTPASLCRPRHPAGAGAVRLAGAQGPASITACVTVANAEVLAGLVVHQLGKAGAPFLMGVGTGVMNMQTAVKVNNGPGVWLGNQAQLDVIRWYGLPSWHYTGHSDSKALDEQWALELESPRSWCSARHPAPRRRLPRERHAERARGPRAGRRARRLRTRDPRRASRRRRGDRAGRDRGRRARRQPPRDQDDATRAPALLAAVADRPEHPRALGCSGGRTTLLERVRERLAEVLAAEPAFTLDAATGQVLDELSGAGRSS